MTAEVSAIELVWLFWAISWFGSGLFAARAIKRPDWRREAIPYLLESSGLVLLLIIVSTHHNLPLWELWRLPAAWNWALLAVAALGFVFTWWARATLGRLWSGRVTKKSDHHVVDTGPYGIVRHPIYTGLLLAAFATAAIKGTALALAGCALLVIGWSVKARLEERFLSEELGAETDGSYRRRVPMLIPFLHL
ncbi:MAG: isoprenylcysteine carboxylmethyltransferase family protein [Alphaproteobacteria bacterium]|nr:isoprenylcysteine carboxylmethyltransferase family protein [Alphaproteobacteria bacterium]